MTAEPNPKAENSVEGKRRRLTLMESYDPELSAFSDSKLSEISNAIRTISAPNAGISPHGEIRSEVDGEPPGIPSGQIVRPLFASPSHSPRGELGVSPYVSPSDSSHVSPNRSPGGEIHDEMMILTSNQALLYECIKILNGRFTTLARISKAVNISVDTLRSCLRKLRKIGAVDWSVENISGQNGMRISAAIMPYAVRGSRNALDDKLANLDHAKLALNSRPEYGIHQVTHQVGHQVNNQVDHQVTHQVGHQVSHQIFNSSSSSINKTKKLLLRDLEISLLLEGHFHDLDVRSLEPYLDQFESLESLQLFLDMANASIDASKTNAKPIQNPHGFLFAQLRAGYVNPPPGFKSRRVLAQEAMNAQLQAELAALQRLREQEAELRFELFKAGLTDEQRAALDVEAAKRVQPKAAVSRERQMDVYRDEVLLEWFAQERG